MKPRLDEVGRTFVECGYSAYSAHMYDWYMERKGRMNLVKVTFFIYTVWCALLQRQG